MKVYYQEDFDIPSPPKLAVCLLLLSYCLNNMQSPHSSFHSSVWSNTLPLFLLYVPLSLIPRTFVGEIAWVYMAGCCASLPHDETYSFQALILPKTLFVISWEMKDRCLVNMCSYNPAVSLPCNGSLALFIFLVFGVAELTVGECTIVRSFKVLFYFAG